MKRSAVVRYNDAAIILHWMIAALILGLLGVGKFMVSLDDTDPLRYALTQWHKTFGFCVLALSVLRVVWRIASPPAPSGLDMPAWQERAAGATHLLLYALTFVLPVTGWIMVSASPLDIDTLLFNVVAVPHLPPFDTLANRAAIAEQFAHYHELASHILILLLLMHIGAALKHQLLDRDGVLLRMVPDTRSHGFRRAIAVTLCVVLGLGAVLVFQAQQRGAAVQLAAGESEVRFMAAVSGDDVAGVFVDSEVDAQFDSATGALVALSSTVQTGAVMSSNPSVQNQLPDTEWFDAAQFPVATFQSTSVENPADGTVTVQGELNLKGTVQAVRFALEIETVEGARTASGQFAVDRRDFNIGLASQPTDETVGFDVWVMFEFVIETGAAASGAGASGAASP